MKAVVLHSVGDIRLDDVREPTVRDPTVRDPTVQDPTVQDPTDAIVRLTTAAIREIGLHVVRGTFAGMETGTILGHEGVGISRRWARRCATSGRATGGDWLDDGLRLTAYEAFDARWTGWPKVKVSPRAAE